MVVGCVELAGCQASLKATHERTRDNGDGSTDKTTVSACAATHTSLCTGQTNNFMRSIAEMVASVTGFTYSEWQGLDVAEYEIHINPSFGATATIDRNEATVKVFSSGQEISSRAFPVVKVGNIAKFSNPENIKNWSLQFVDIADNVEIEYDTTVKSRLATPVSVQQQVKEQSEILATVTYSVLGNTGCSADPDDDFHETDPDACIGM